MGATMTMNAGRLVWSRNGRTGAWFVEAADNEDRRYVVEREGGGWRTVVKYRFGHEDVELGHRSFIKEAKRLADAHHHARIKESDDEALQGLRDYIARYPLS